MLEQESGNLKIAVASEDMLSIKVAKEMVSAANATLEKANSAMQQRKKTGKQIQTLHSRFSA